MSPVLPRKPDLTSCARQEPCTCPHPPPSATPPQAQAQAGPGDPTPAPFQSVFVDNTSSSHTQTHRHLLMYTHALTYDIHTCLHLHAYPHLCLLHTQTLHVALDIHTNTSLDSAVCTHIFTYTVVYTHDHT